VNTRATGTQSEIFDWAKARRFLQQANYLREEKTFSLFKAFKQKPFLYPVFTVLISGLGHVQAETVLEIRFSPFSFRSWACSSRNRSCIRFSPFSHSGLGHVQAETVLEIRFSPFSFRS